MKKRYIVLENGRVFEGIAFGADKETTGEIVFTTGMCGYIETLTDPSYFGQIVIQTFPMIGNYGIIPDDFEGKCCLLGYVVREWCDEPSNFRCEKDLDSYLKECGIPGVYGVDTREMTKIIRESGVMNASICDSLPADDKAIKDYAVREAVKNVTADKPYVIPAADGHRFNVTLIDYGAKHNIARELAKRGCTVRIVPSTTSAAEILRDRPDGVMLSNGPGDPAENTYEIGELKSLMGKVPMFGICLGHQLLALANGGTTVKLKYGHRGVNQPVRDVLGERTFITSQNHGYAVVSDSIKNGTVRYVNANDGTCEGIDYDGAFSVQFHPEACSGPRDTEFLFDRFIEMMGGGK